MQYLLYSPHSAVHNTSFTQVKATILQYRNNVLQAKTLHVLTMYLYVKV